jgi:hypothetical protein
MIGGALVSSSLSQFVGFGFQFVEEEGMRTIVSSSLEATRKKS